MLGKRVLLVEDNPADVELTARAFQKACIVDGPVVARDGQEALDYLSALGAGSFESHQAPSLVLLDLKLPKLDGFQVLAGIRANPCTRLLPTVILTSSGESSDVVRAYECGANSYLRKPVDFDLFVEMLKCCCNYWLVLNETPPPV
jgi:two-component system, response regulator